MNFSASDIFVLIAIILAILSALKDYIINPMR
jgi:hypothetical protein